MRAISALCYAAMLTGCAMTSQVMDTGNGTYMISAQASAVRGGVAGANDVAYKDANAFCVAKGGHAVVIGANSQDLPMSAIAGSWNSSGGSFGGGTFHAGNADLRFRCGS